MKERGFTLIELLVTIVIVGILAAIAVPRLGQTSDRAIVAQMQADLDQLRSAQELYYQTNTMVYAGDIADLVAADLFQPTVGVTIVINSADATSWAASASHTASPVTCDFDAAVGVIDCT